MLSPTTTQWSAEYLEAIAGHFMTKLVKIHRTNHCIKNKSRLNNKIINKML
jgi:hypothetical protein